MSENKNPSYPIEVVNHYTMNRILRHRLRNLCAGVKMTAERIAATTAAINPQIGSRCDIVIAEVENLREFTDRMDLLFDALPAVEPKTLFDLVVDARTFFAPKFPFGKLSFDGPETILTFVHGSWLQLALRELLTNAGEASSSTGAVKLAWQTDPDGFTFVLENSGEPFPAEIPVHPPAPFMTAKSRHDGLGLAIVWRIGTAIGATVSMVPGSEDQPTRITLKLPLAEIQS